MKLERDVVGRRTIATPNNGKPSATHSERSRGFDLMVSSMLLALLVASIAMGNAASDEIGGVSAHRPSYFASALDFVVNFGLSIGLTWLLFSRRPYGENKGPNP
jgi:hypothetical protein